MGCRVARSRPAPSMSSRRSQTFPNSLLQGSRSVRNRGREESAQITASSEISEIIALLRDKTGHDFSAYKQARCSVASSIA